MGIQHTPDGHQLRKMAEQEAQEAGAGPELSRAIGELWEECSPQEKCVQAAISEIFTKAEDLALAIPEAHKSGSDRVFGAFLLLAERIEVPERSLQIVRDSMLSFCRKCFTDGPEGKGWKSAIQLALEAVVDEKRGEKISVAAFAPEGKAPYLRIALLSAGKEEGAFEYHATRETVDATGPYLMPAEMLRFNSMLSAIRLGQLGGPTTRVPKELLQIERAKDLLAWGKFQTALDALSKMN